MLAVAGVLVEMALEQIMEYLEFIAGLFFWLQVIALV